jgi:hypothetical protein
MAVAARAQTSGTLAARILTLRSVLSEASSPFDKSTQDGGATGAHRRWTAFVVAACRWAVRRASGAVGVFARSCARVWCWPSQRQYLLPWLMEIGAVEETVTVSGAGSSVNKQTPELSFLVGAQARIESLPLSTAATTRTSRCCTPGSCPIHHGRRLGGGAWPRNQRQRSGLSIPTSTSSTATLQNDFTNGPAGSAGGHGARHGIDSRVSRRIERLQRGVRPQLRRSDQLH